MLGVVMVAGAAIATVLQTSDAAGNDPDLHTPETHAPAPRPPYAKLRYDEDYSFLRDPARRIDPFDALKDIPLDDSGDWRLTLGGEARLRYEFYRNYRWDPDSPDDDGYLLQRYLLHADLHLGRALRAFGQLQSSLEDWRAGGPRPVDENRLDVHQLFGDARVPFDSGDDSVTLRVGRQEMAYGSQRLISVRESPNIRRAFDAARVLVNVGGARVDAFFARPVEDDQGTFDDWGDDHVNFWGVYATLPLAGAAAQMDVYYLGLRRPDAEFADGAADELRHSVGARAFGKSDGWDYNVEGVVQFGAFGDRDIFAWTLASDAGFTFSGAPFEPRLGLKTDVISGTTRPGGGGRLGTFNALFPRGAYFGEAALIGPANLLDVHPTLDLQLSETVTLSADWDIFWRYSVDDGLYDNGGNVLRPAGGDERFIGHQASVGLSWDVDAHAEVHAAYSHFFAGDYLRDSGPGADVDFVGVWLIYRF